MKTLTAVFLTAFAALIFAACGAPPPNNAPVNTNTNTVKAPSAPAANDLLTLDKGATDAYFKGDAKYFETFLSDKFGWTEKGKHMTKADVLKEIAGVKCDVKSFSLDEPQMSKVDDDTYVLTYKSTADGSCTENGKTDKIKSPMRAASVFVRNGDKWQGAWHGETLMMEPKKDEKAEANTAKRPDEKAEAKKEDAKTEPKKEEPKKEMPKKDDKPANTASNANTAAAPASEAPKADPNTDALVKLETGGWEAWRDHDAKKLDDMSAKSLAFIDPSGKWFGTRAEVLKEWEGAECKDIKNVSVKNGFAWALSPTVELLSFDATADGMCGGMKNGTMHGTSLYIKEGDAWKIAFAYLSPAANM